MHNTYMRIAYIAGMDFMDSDRPGKLQEQVSGWEKLGHEVRIFSLSGNDLFNNVLSGYKLQRALRRYAPDVVYYRQGLWFPALDAITKKYPAVMEVSTVNGPAYASAGYLERHILSYGNKKILKQLKGMVCDTEETSRKYWHHRVPSVVISNGIDLSSVNGEATRKEMKARPQLVFSATGGTDWNGLDKVLLLARCLPQFDFHIVGENSPQGLVPSNVFLHGALAPADERLLYRSMDVGIGMLALYRARAEEACPRKVREYCRFGLPVICAYYDVDLAGREYMLRLENREDNIKPNLEKIQEFVTYWHGRRVNPASLRDFLDTSVKEAGRIAFLKQVVTGNHRSI